MASQPLCAGEKGSPTVQVQPPSPGLEGCGPASGDGPWSETEASGQARAVNRVQALGSLGALHLPKLSQRSVVRSW